MDHVCGCGEVAGGDGLFELVFKAGLNDGDFTSVDAVDVGCVDINAGDPEAVVGHDDGGGQADVAEAHEGDGRVRQLWFLIGDLQRVMLLLDFSLSLPLTT